MTRRTELIDRGATAKEIQSIIQREFNIFLSSRDIQAKIDARITQESNNTDQHSVNPRVELLEKITSILPPNGLKSREISAELRQRFNVKIPKRDVFRLLYPSDKVSYSPITFRWTIQSERGEKGTRSQLSDLIPPFVKFISELKSQAENSIIESRSGFPLLDSALMHVVRDNVISQNEVRFLKHLSTRVGFNGDIDELIQKNLHAQNPYLDSLIHGAFHDGIIEDYEVHTIAEQGNSIGFNEQFLGQRFWSIAFTDYFKDLLNIPSFDRFLKLSFIRQCRGQKAAPLEDLIRKVHLSTKVQFANEIESLSENAQSLVGNELNDAEKGLLASDTSQILTPSEQNAPPIHEGPREHKHLSVAKVIKIMHDEKDKLGDPVANLLVENVLFQIDLES